MLLTHPGASQADIGVPGTIRQDMSEYLAASLIPENNGLGFIRVGAEFGDGVLRFMENRLNSDQVTDVGGGQAGSGTVTTITVSNADGALLDVGYKLADISVAGSSTGGPANSEHMRVTNKSVGNTQTIVSLERAMDGTSQTAHANNAIYTIISTPTIENSSLGPDMSRARLAKFNYMTRIEGNVNISSEQIEKSRAGYVPGVNDELEFQFYERLQEKLRILAKMVWMSRPNPGQNGTAGQVAGDYSTFAGVHAWLDGTWNATAATYDFAANGIAAGQLDTPLNFVNAALYRNGARVDWAAAGPNVARDLGRLYADRIRMDVNDTSRGFAATFFRTDMTNEVRMLLDPYIQDTAPAAELYAIDSSRLRLRFFLNQMFYILAAPSLNDGDATRFLMKPSLEMRNTGSDAGQAHYLIKNITP